MARGTTVGEVLTQLRNELFESSDPAFGKQTREAYLHQISKHHERLCTVYDWPFLRTIRYIATAAGQRYYDFPEDLDFDRIESTHYKWGGSWQPVSFGIDPRENYNGFDSLSGVKSDPILRWGPYNDDPDGGNQFEVWPVPSFDGRFYQDQPIGTAYQENTDMTGNGVLRFRGFRRGRPLVEDSDRLDLDDTLVVLNAAATIMRRKDPQKAAIIQSEAKSHLDRLKSSYRKSRCIVMGGSEVTRPTRPWERIQVVSSGS